MIKRCQESISLTYENPSSFVICQWQKDLKPNWVYLIYRSLVASLFLIACLISIILHDQNDYVGPRKGLWMIYLTHWGLLLCVLQFIWAFALLSISFITKRQDVKTYKIYWVLQTIALDLSIIITILYWSLVYMGEKINFDDAFKHVFNTVFMLIDLFLISHPVNFLHAVFSIIFGLCYGLFTVIYYYLGGTNRYGKPYIYEVLYWKNPITSSMICVGVVFGILIVHAIVWMLFKLRTYIYSKTLKKKQNQQSTETA